MKFASASMVLATVFSVALHSSDSTKDIKAIVLKAAQEKRIEEFIQGKKVGGNSTNQIFAVVIFYDLSGKYFGREYFAIDINDMHLYKEALKQSSGFKVIF